MRSLNMTNTIVMYTLAHFLALPIDKVEYFVVRSKSELFSSWYQLENHWEICHMVEHVFKYLIILIVLS